MEKADLIIKLVRDLGIPVVLVGFLIWALFFKIIPDFQNQIKEITNAFKQETEKFREELKEYRNSITQLRESILIITTKVENYINKD